MSLKTRITEDMKNALRAHETARLGAIRLLLAAIKQREVDERIELDDTAIIGVIDKMLKQRKDSIEQYQKAKRQDLVDAEQFEVTVLSGYMPQQLSAIEIESIIAAAITESGAKSMQEMGKVMAIAKPKLAGRADMGEASKLIKAKLAG
ncbi:MAG: GatB/YqeY domain-containing protein [Betaproteobacteria bacterium]|nr:GatB/YqeY domain-containing protein [Betaproteobacteria bacterium]